MDQMRILDLGAGIGLVGEQLNSLGAKHMLAIDVTEQGKFAVMRDRPNLYQNYLVADMSTASESVLDEVKKFSPTSLCCVSSLNVVPVDAWIAVYRTIPIGGYVAFNILAGALSEQPPQSCMNGSNALVRHLLRSGQLETKASLTYQHRLSSSGTPVMYTAVVGKKLNEISVQEGRKLDCPSW